jgi:NADH dehydrogenase (ubiquinone) 1 alpha subcomplex subunit 9
MAARLFIVQNFRVCAIQQTPKTATVAIVVKRNAHDVVRSDQHDNLSAYRRGKGGRASFSGIVATVFGASGYLGRYVVSRLGKIGSQVICPYRGEPYYMKDLKVSGELGQILFLPFDLRDEESIRQCMKYSNVVINLVGRDWTTKNFSFDAVHVDGARRLARIARESGVERFIHMSHLNAQPNPPSIFVKGGSKFLISKHFGELAVKEEFPNATVLRPADIFGLEDRFLRYYASGWRRGGGASVPLWKKGMETIKRPVSCSNVAEGIIKAVQDPSTAGQTYECIGPNGYYLADLVDYIYRCMRWPSVKAKYISPMFKLKVMYMSYAPTYPILTMDKLDREHVSDIPQDLPTLEDLGVKLTPLEDRAPFELKPFRLHSYYEEHVGEFAHPEPPPVVSV